MIEDKISEEQKIANFKKRIASIENREESKVGKKPYRMKKGEIHRIAVYVLLYVSSTFFFSLLLIQSLVYAPGYTVSFGDIIISKAMIDTALLIFGIFLLISFILFVIVLIKKIETKKQIEKRKIQFIEKTPEEYTEEMDQFFEKLKD
ncbi:MAG: hypothetical protein JXA99_04625 [Candidatus Lokiarchaeota archaeon]|nr:hypothetical protein [Candidatus Lokiarchaeota archaeon]